MPVFHSMQHMWCTAWGIACAFGSASLCACVCDSAPCFKELVAHVPRCGKHMCTNTPLGLCACSWYAIPENSMERSIASGELHGSMWGVRKSKAGDSPDGPDAGDDVIHQKQEEEEHEERDDGDDDNDDREEEKHHSHKHRHSHEDKHAGKQSGHDAEDGEDAEVPEWHADGPKGTERMAHIKLGHADRVAANYRRLMGHQL